jgi:hypothetical protein
MLRLMGGILNKKPFGESVAGEMDSSNNDDVRPESTKEGKRWSGLNALILGLVLLLGVVVPPPYNAFAPILLVIPLIIAVVRKARQAGERSGSPQPNQTYSPPVPDSDHSVQPYSYTPKDPKDPRRYKPIG